MIDIQVLRENPDLVARKSTEKNIEVDVKKVLKLDSEYRDLLQQVEQMRSKRNTLSAKMKSGKPDSALIDEGRQLKVELADRENLLKETKTDFDTEFQKIPNLHFDDVPIGEEGEGEEVSQFGDCQSTGAEDHLDYAVKKGWLDFERGAKVAGTKFYFVRGDLALLENAVVQYALGIVSEEGFEYMTVPHMANSRATYGAGFAPRSSKESNEYFVEDEDLSLIATAEVPLTGFHADEAIDEDKLPLFYAGYSPCYRKEAGTYGKHTRGLFRVHQFNKLEMYAYTLPEKSSGIHDKMLAVEERIWKDLEIPYRVINIPSGDLGAPAAKKYDIEYWSKVDGEFRELTSCSNCTDFQSRNLDIRVKRKDGKTELLHTLNGTAVSLARTLIAIIEHYQNDDGSLRIPKVLQKYMGDKKTI